MKRSLTGRRFIALVGVFGLAGCSGSPMASVSPTAPSVAAGGSAVVGTMTDTTDPCVASLSTNTLASATTQPPPCEEPALSGRFTGGGFQIADVKVTRGFTIHCDNLLTNNLEVNWGGGNNFHMAKNTLTQVRCSRPVDPTPPAAPVARIVASAVGRCNGAPATINFVLEDRGEPGREDRAALFISGAGSCNLNLPEAFLDGGNIQAHFDQPHKK